MQIITIKNRYLELKGGALSVTIIAEGNGIDDPSSNPGWGCFKQLIVILFTNPSARARYDTRSIFKRSLTGLNSVFLLLD